MLPWNFHTLENIKKLEQIQRRAFRFITNDNERTGLTEKMKRNGWKPLAERRVKQKVRMLKKAELGQAAIPTSHLKLNRRKEATYAIPFSRTNSHLKSFFPDTVRLWNSIPVEMKMKNCTLEHFNSKIEKLSFRPEF